jgi:protein arginine kinase
MPGLKLDELANRCGEWLRGQGPQSEIVISSRIRLARNLSSFPFIRRCSESDRVAVDKTFRDAIASVPEWKGLIYVNVASELSAIDRQFLVERQLISRELSESSGARSVFIDAAETFSLMINEEDHLRMQVMHSGLDLDAAWQQISQMDDWLDERVGYAFHERLGYLTACPTNVGTGMRVSVMLHLPAACMARARRPWATSIRSAIR